ncbi:MAG: ComF family protein [Armatimonadetes bacterium]|nr:ComF family protein [Armatimonadota bacterium]
MTKAETSLTRFSKAALDLLYPRYCVLCRTRPEEPFCAACRTLALPMVQGTCVRCGLGPAGECRACLWMGRLDWLRSAVDYDGVAGKAVQKLKYARHSILAKPMAGQMRPVLEQVPDSDRVVPVPIHWTRRAMRGFNQSDLLAEGLAAGTVRHDLLRRVRATRPQVMLTSKQRLRNLEGAFKARPCRGGRVLLIDDVVTSGGTLEACAGALKAAGASWVGALTYARELTDRERRALEQ